MWIRSLGTTVSQQVKKNIYEHITKHPHVFSCLLLTKVDYQKMMLFLFPRKSILKQHQNQTQLLVYLKAMDLPSLAFQNSLLRDHLYSSSEPEISLKPKFDFFISKGIYGFDLAKFISSDPQILRESLTTQIIPVFDILKNIVHCDESIITILRRHPWILRNKLDIRKMMLNIELLRGEGVPQSNMSRFLPQQPRPFTVTSVKFKEIVEEVKCMGLDPSKIAFLHAIQTLTGMSKSTWEKKMNAYKGWGWSEDVIMNAFKQQPRCMGTSEKKITLTMDYLVNQMGWSSSLIANHPVVFSYSLEKRIKPRCSVYRILTSKGLVKNQIAMSSLIVMSEKAFSLKFVKEYAEEVPELLKVYQGKFNSQEFTNSSASGRLSEGK